jgi:membrane-associated phospholipid phosphatase
VAAVSAVHGHVRRLWGPLWPVPCLPLVYALLMLAIGDLRPEHVVFAVACLALGFASHSSKRFLIDAAPYVLVAIGYDLVRYGRRFFVSSDRVLGCELRALELKLFRVAPGVTIQDWFARHHTFFADLVFAVPYAIFAYVAFIYAAYLYFNDRPRMRHYLWSFALANYVSFALWLLVPAAPPWYVRAHGCAIDLAVLPSAAGLARVDAALGIGYFHAFYSRTASVFGAIPSMHCAYPLIGLLTAWRKATWRTWPIHVGYTLLMFAASVYLDHHYVIDGLVGWVVGAGAVWIAGRLLRVFEQNQQPAAVGETASQPASGG